MLRHIAKAAAADSGPSRGRADDQLMQLTDAQINRWADLIAEERDGFPDNVSLEDRERLTTAVRERLRRRLVHLIARAIAARLHHQHQKEDQPHARTQV